MITSIYGLHKVYFHDMQILARNSINPTIYNTMENGKLDEYLRVMNIPMKHPIGSYTTLQMRLNTQTQIDDIILYCIYDCMALSLLNDKLQAIPKMLTLGMDMQVPLSWALHNTVAKCQDMVLKRLAIQAGCVITYRVLSEKTRYQGALTYSNEDTILKVQEDVYDLDFASLYPSIIMANNLSPETIIISGEVDPSSYTVIQGNDSTHGEFETRVYRREVKEGFIVRYLKGMFNRRREIKALLKTEYKLELDLAQYSIKIAMNSLYGMLGSSSSTMA
jgi:DNA polymerase elongation subunit (family B)